DYASYVILERAVPYVEDGLKPVQRRILHSMWELEDGRYNKVANIIGHTMKYHPHGDVSIGDALVQLGQKDLLIDCQGNWGNILTGDDAAAPRYIEARLSKFALEVAFNPKTTVWKSSYDGRNKEPVTLPIKFPLLLAQGVEGIAVGLACKILPHNFNELIEASIDILRGKSTDILPDFPTGGYADFTNYNNGLRGGKVRVRAKINQLDKKTLVISEIPFGTTTSSLIDSILKANEKEKIKVRKVEDNTAENVEIVIHLAPGISPDKTIDALYAFTDCEISISPNSCIIQQDKPVFLGVNEILKICTQNTLHLLKRELEIRKAELEEDYFFASLEQIFINEEMYIPFKEYDNKPDLFAYLDKRFEPYKKSLLREIVEADFEKLTQIPMIRITRFDSSAADEKMRKLKDQIAELVHHLEHLIDFAVEYYKNLKKKYGKGKERKTEIKQFDNIVATRVAVANEKLYVNREEGFAGFGMKKDEYVSDCSDIDDIIVFREDGTMIVTKVTEKAFVGKNIIHISVFKKNDNRTIYNMIYRDGKYGAKYVKRFAVTGVTRDKEYVLSKGTKDSKVLYFTANPNGESELVNIQLRPRPSLKKLQFDVDFGEVIIKGRDAQGNILTREEIRKIVQKEKGVSTLAARQIWFDDSVQRLNAEGRGTLLGRFSGDDKILAIYQSGHYRLYGFDLSTHFEEELILIEKFNPNKPIMAVYWDNEHKQFNIKRFIPESSDKKVLFISESEGSALELISGDKYPVIELVYLAEKINGEYPKEVINAFEFIDVKGYKAKGNRLTNRKVKEINLLEPLPAEEEAEPEPEIIPEADHSENLPEQNIGSDISEPSESVEDIKLPSEDPNHPVNKNQPPPQQLGLELF
ncbi:MAG: DNA gyrase/topoisomerase IV subunit A, partial [Bacteroidia bacterium]|nr:DNA gyrase/topoisomerase IV subunit A [Bacteroidia bacterium]